MTLLSRQIIHSILLRGRAALSPLIRSKIGCALSPPTSDFKNRKLITYNVDCAPKVDQEKPNITVKSCIFDPKYNGVYTGDGSLVSCSALIRGKRNERFNAPERIFKYGNWQELPTCIYGGILFGSHYGHCLTETMSRLWPFQDRKLINEWGDIPILFRMAGDKQSSMDEIALFTKNILEVLGVRNRILIPDKQVFVENMIIPHASIVNNYKSHKVYVELMQMVGDRLLEKYTEKSEWHGKKIYLSRSKLPQHTRHLANEKQLENILVKNGYTIVHSQKMPFIEQIKMFNEVDEIVGSIGSAFHTLSLTRNPNVVIKYLVDKSHRGTTYNNIDAALGIKSTLIHCTYPHILTLKKSSFKDQIIDLNRAMKGIVDTPAH